MERKMKKFLLCIILIIAGSAPASAADRYQIISIGQRGTTDLMTYNALRIDLDSGAFLICIVIFSNGGSKLTPVGCLHPNSIAGEVPPGPAVISNGYISSGPYPGFWKISQQTGLVTFCAEGSASGSDPGMWMCAPVPVK
jgi:hypothetical protein